MDAVRKASTIKLEPMVANRTSAEDMAGRVRGCVSLCAEDGK